MAAVAYEKQDRIGIITIDNPPVNALGHAVRQGLQDALAKASADPEVRAIALICAGRTFSAGADITEFGKPMASPQLREVIDAFEASAKPVVAAIHGTALGGGLELALGCHYRIAVRGAKIGLPEVKLGLLPGAGGTQRLPRLAGVEAALSVIVEGNPVAVEKAKSMGIIDELVDGDLRAAAIDYAAKLVAESRPPRPTRALDVPKAALDVFDEFERAIAKKQRGFVAPFHAIKAVRAAAERPFEAGMKLERDLFVELMGSPQSKAQRHVFFAEREVAKIPGLPADAPTREIARAGVIGAGTMGGGIAMCFANAGIPVTVVETGQEALDRGMATIRKNYAGSVSRGSITQEEMDKRLARFKPSLALTDLADADIIIEAVFEEMGIKKDVFGKLDAIAKPGAILASNTSYLDIDEIAATTRRPADVLGMHFFSPANVMKLLENVRGAKSAPDVLATAQKVGKRIGKVPVMVGVCDGFVGNRMLAKRSREAFFLLEEGALPWQVDKVLRDFGFPMGPFAMADLAGLDVGWRNRKAKIASLTPREQQCDILDQICVQGRYGQKTGAGFYRYDEKRNPTPDPEIEKLIVAHSAKVGITRRAISDEEILERTMYSMVNEAAKILEEGVAARPHDIDIVWIYGYGFPVYRGGPMFWADEVGLPKILEAVLRYRETVGAEYWQPAPRLERLAREGRGFYSPGAAPLGDRIR
jgi:3-hydroxyacyl-CoA dehydrogenase